MVKEVVPELSCPLALFTYYNPILKRGVANFMSVVKEAGVHVNALIVFHRFSDVLLHWVNVWLCGRTLACFLCSAVQTGVEICLFPPLRRAM